MKELLLAGTLGYDSLFNPIDIKKPTLEYKPKAEYNLGLERMLQERVEIKEDDLLAPPTDEEFKQFKPERTNNLGLVALDVLGGAALFYVRAADQHRSYQFNDPHALHNLDMLNLGLGIIILTYGAYENYKFDKPFALSTFANACATLLYFVDKEVKGSIQW